MNSLSSSAVRLPDAAVPTGAASSVVLTALSFSTLDETRGRRRLRFSFIHARPFSSANTLLPMIQRRNSIMRGAVKRGMHTVLDLCVELHDGVVIGFAAVLVNPRGRCSRSRWVSSRNWLTAASYAALSIPVVLVISFSMFWVI